VGYAGVPLKVFAMGRRFCPRPALRHALQVTVALPALILLAASVIVWAGGNRMLLFPALPANEREEVRRLTAHLPHGANIQLSPASIAEYHDKGYTILRGAVDTDTLEAMKTVMHHVYTHPNGMLRRGNGSNFCGFSLHNHLLVPAWRELAYKLPLAKVAGELMGTDDVVYSQDIFHATTSHCGNGSVSGAHSDANQSPFSVERKRRFGDNMMVAWIAVDPLDHITMDLFGGTHDAGNYTSEGFSGEKYCKCAGTASRRVKASSLLAAVLLAQVRRGATSRAGLSRMHTLAGV